MPDPSKTMNKTDASDVELTSSKRYHSSAIVNEHAIQKDYPSHSSLSIIRDTFHSTSFHANTQQPSKSTRIQNQNQHYLEDISQSVNITPIKTGVNSQRMTRSSFKSSRMDQPEHNSFSVSSLNIYHEAHTPAAEQKIKRKARIGTAIKAPEPYLKTRMECLSQSSLLTSPRIPQGVYSIASSSNTSPMLTAFSNIRLVDHSTNSTNPPTPIAAGSNKVYHGIDNRMITEVVEVEQTKKQPHSEGSTLVEDCTDEYFDMFLRPYSKSFELGPCPGDNRRDLNDFSQDFSESEDNSDISNASTPDTTFSQLDNSSTSLIFERWSDDDSLNSIYKASPLSAIIKEYATKTINAENTVTQVRRTRSQKVTKALELENLDEVPIKMHSRYELHDSDIKKVTFSDQVESLEDTMHDSLRKLSEMNHLKSNAISESEAHLSNTTLFKQLDIQNSIHQTIITANHDVRPYTYLQEQRKYHYQGVDAMIVMLGWHSTWTRYLVPKIDDFYQITPHAAERSDVVVGYYVSDKRAHPYADQEFDENLNAWCMEGERIFHGYALGISVKSGDQWVKLGPGSVSVSKKDDVLWMCSLGRSKFKSWASSEAPEMKAMGRVFGCSNEESDGIVQSINVDLGREFRFEMMAKDVVELRNLLVI